MLVYKQRTTVRRGLSVDPRGQLRQAEALELPRAVCVGGRGTGGACGQRRVAPGRRARRVGDGGATRNGARLSSFHSIVEKSIVEGARATYRCKRSPTRRRHRTPGSPSDSPRRLCEWTGGITRQIGVRVGEDGRAGGGGRDDGRVFRVFFASRWLGSPRRSIYPRRTRERRRARPMPLRDSPGALYASTRPPP